MDHERKKRLELLRQKALWVRKETLKIHKIAPETRLASSLSAVEILVCLYYGKILNYNPRDIYWENRDRFLISKGHGSISLYPILADLGYFDRSYLGRVCKKGSFLGAIPDPIIPGYETMNGSLGHGLGIACGMALALKRKEKTAKVFVLLGDGELYEGSIWEAVMFAGAHRLNNIVAIIDNNKMCMLDLCKNILNIEPLDEKFAVYNWNVRRVDGHDVTLLYDALIKAKNNEEDRPNIIIADTIKGKGVPSLENDPLCHIRSLTTQEIDSLIHNFG